MMSTSRGQLVFAMLVLVAARVPAVAEVKLVTVDVPADKVWVGQKAPFFVKLRAKGPFVGAASFSLPQVPRTVILKIGNPVVSTEEIEGDTWFVQSHEFALFSQVDGTVEVPSFHVRFANRDDFTGPARDHDELVPAIQFQVARPPASSAGTFLVTTDSLEVEQTWDPTPGETKQGAVFHRIITQQADQITGMALAPPPMSVPEGVRVHFEDPTISDNTERGAFTGGRTDRITYELRQPGTVTLPAIEYVWWNPDSQEFGSTILPAATFEVAALDPPSEAERTEATSYSAWKWLAIILLACGLCYWQRHRLVAGVAYLGKKLNPPERQAARRLLHACRKNDAPAAEAAWSEWQTLGHAVVTPRLTSAATGLQRTLFGCAGQAPWSGAELAAAFKECQASRHAKSRIDESLPQLNPTR